MAEIPDIYLLANQIKERIAGKKIVDVAVSIPAAVNHTEEECKHMLLGDVVKDVLFKGRRIYISMKGGSWIVLYPGGMDFLSYNRILFLLDGRKVEDIAGRGIVWSCMKPHYYDDVSKIIRFSLQFDGNARLVIIQGGEDKYVKGMVEIFTNDQYKENKNVRCTGLNVMDEGSFTCEKFLDRLLKKKGDVQQVLLGDSIVEGMTSIMTYESLFRAGIHPEREVIGLKEGERYKLYEGIRTFAWNVAESGGMFFRMNLDGTMGRFNDFALFNRKNGEPCKVCSTPIQRYKGKLNRYTYVCTGCQK